ncbi:hypothetical protein B0J12DRAFT_235961 [Macrophomina phaseolina]|uniref:Uncharacterized protein n=1 Tax=Macrophomina phaseolina TaxID=35725 RepID=A0ABQ8GTC8_9PEZI|nr:hypothetical protein B0J12DRAFT_235961 [Macrophomina phaseolina]
MLPQAKKKKKNSPKRSKPPPRREFSYRSLIFPVKPTEFSQRQDGQDKHALMRGLEPFSPSASPSSPSVTTNSGKGGSVCCKRRKRKTFLRSISASFILPKSRSRMNLPFNRRHQFRPSCECPPLCRVFEPSISPSPRFHFPLHAHSSPILTRLPKPITTLFSAAPTTLITHRLPIPLPSTQPSWRNTTNILSMISVAISGTNSGADTDLDGRVGLHLRRRVYAPPA